MGYWSTNDINEMLGTHYEIYVHAWVRPDCHGYNDDILLFETDDREEALKELRIINLLYTELYAKQNDAHDYRYANALTSKYGRDIEFCSHKPVLLERIATEIKE